MTRMSGLMRGVSAALVAASAISLAAANEGAMKVTVLRPDGTPLAGVRLSARVAISSPVQINSAIVTHTNAYGEAIFTKLSPGIFVVQVDVEGFQSGAIRTDVKVDQMNHIRVMVRPLSEIEVAVRDIIDTLDVTSYTTEMNLRREMIDRLPVGRNIVDKLLLSPSVLNNTAYPALSDPALINSLQTDPFIGKFSSWNTVLLDGMETTSFHFGRNGADVPSEIIADMDIKAGGVSAEYMAKSGAFINTSTINGGNTFSGGVSYRMGTGSLDARSRNAAESSYSSSDSVVYVSGPIIKDKLWFVLSGQKISESKDFRLPDAVALTPGETRKSNLRDEKNLFAKLVFQPHPEHRFIAEYHANPRTSDDANELDWPTNYVQTYKGGGDRGLLWYSWQRPEFTLDFRVSRQNINESISPNVPGPNITIDSLNPLDSAHSRFGGAGMEFVDTARTDTLRADLVFPFRTGDASHTVKVGYQQQSIANLKQMEFSGTMMNVDQNVTIGSLVDNHVGLIPYFLNQVLDSVNSGAHPALVASLDANHDGVVSMSELYNYRFSELYDPAHPEMGAAGIRMLQTGAPTGVPMKAESNGFYIQDSMTFGRFTATLGLRSDHYGYKDSSGGRIGSMIPMVAPRIGFIYDIDGDAKSKVYANYGRYYDPMNGLDLSSIGMTSDTPRSVDLRMGGEWVNFLTLGGGGPAFVALADDIRMPYTDEIRIGYTRTFEALGGVFSFNINGAYRMDRDMVDDYDPCIYSDPNALEASARSLYGLGDAPVDQLSPQAQSVIKYFRGLAIPIERFAGSGMTGQQNFDNYRTVYINVPGGKRDYRSLEVTVQKIDVEKWGGMATFTLLNATGNNVSRYDSSFLGNIPDQDARLPYMYGKLPGSVDWMARVYGFYNFDSGFRLGAVFNASSGYHYSDLTSASAITMLSPSGNINDFSKKQAGKNMTPSRRTLDGHLEYHFRMSTKISCEAFVDVFNVFNTQKPIALAEGMNVRPGYDTGTPYAFEAPRRMVMGFRVKF